MKRLSLLVSVFVALAMCFTSCKDEPNPDLDKVIEDGFYVAGAATGSAKLEVEYKMATGLNEADNSKRAGMYEKYVALEANKEFYLLLREAKVETRYSATLSDFDTAGENDQPTVILQRGALVTGSSAAAMKVSESGLYHIVLDLNEKNDLANPQIIVAPVSWGTRGINGDWGWKEMDNKSGFNRTKMVWEQTFETTNTGDFKFAYGGGWKIQLDNAGAVKANTNLGLEMLNGGENIPIQKGSNVTITLTWSLAQGDIAKSYKMDIAGEFVIENPADFVVGFSGNAFASPIPEWGDPADAALAIYNAAESTIKNQNSKEGTYVYNITNLAFAADKEFKVRYNGAWIGVGGVTIEGATFTGEDNFKVGEAATYDVKFTVEWNGVKATSIKANFTKK